MTGNLKLTCYKCTREGHFVADVQDQAIHTAMESGWVKDRKGYVCPKCPVSVKKDGTLVA